MTAPTSAHPAITPLVPSWADPLSQALNGCADRTELVDGAPALWRFGQGGLEVAPDAAGPWIGVEAEPRAGDGARWFPALLALGTTAGKLIALDLETARIVSLHGEPDLVTAWVDRVAASLAGCRLLTVGHPSAIAETGLGFESLSDAMGFIEGRAAFVRGQLGDAGHESVRRARAALSAPSFTRPVVVIVRAAAAASGPLRALAQVAAGDAGVVALIEHGAGFTPWRAKVLRDQLRLDGLVTPIEHPPLAHRPTASATVPARDAAASGSVMVCVLGPVEIRDPFPRPVQGRPLELAAYVALHPAGASDDAIMMALWPRTRPTRASFNNVVSALRRSLGDDETGQPLLPTRTGPHYRFTEAVTCDLDELGARIQAAGSDLELLDGALALVRGTPFAGRSVYGWALYEGHLARAEMAIADAVLRYARLAVAAGELDRARLALERAIEAVPFDERLHRTRLEVHGAAGNRRGVSNGVDQLLALHQGSIADLEPETRELLTRLRTG